MGIVDISFQSAETNNHARLTRNLNFYFTQWNNNQLFCLNLTVCSSILVVNSTWFTSIKGAAKAAIMWKYWHMLPYTVHDCTKWAWKLLKAFGRMTSSVTESITSSIGYTRWEQCECFCKEQYKAIIISYIGTEIAKVLSCIPRSHYDYIDTAGFLFMMQ